MIIMCVNYGVWFVVEYGGIGLALGDEWLLGGLLLATGDGTARRLLDDNR